MNWGIGGLAAQTGGQYIEFVCPKCWTKHKHIFGSGWFDPEKEKKYGYHHCDICGREWKIAEATSFWNQIRTLIMFIF